MSISLSTNVYTRDREITLPFGEPYTYYAGAWYYPGDPEYRGRGGPYYQPGYEMQPAQTKTTRDVYRKYRSKQLVTTVFGGDALRRWSYLPFYTRSSLFSIDVLKPASQGSKLRPGCAPGIYHPDNACYVQCSVNNNWANCFPSLPTEAGRAIPATGYGTGHTALSVTSSFDSWINSLNLTPLVKKALSGLESASTNFPDMLVVLAELREIMDLMNVPQTASDAWLGYNFGLMPTMGSFKDTLTGAMHRWNSEFKIKTMKFPLKVESTTVRDLIKYTSVATCGQGPEGRCPAGGCASLIETISGMCSLELTYTVTPPPHLGALFASMEKLLERLNMLGDLSTLWELLPFSWLVDYFYPVGTGLKGLSARSGLGRFFGINIVDSYISFSRTHSTVEVNRMYPCIDANNKLVRMEEEYVRMPFANPWDFLSIGGGVQIPTNLSQYLTMIALGVSSKVGSR